MAVFIKPTGGTKTSRRAFAPMADINVTPMVDVMLVLLVIFIVTAPLLTTGVAVKLPQAKAKSLPQDNKPLTIYVERDGAVTLNETKVDLATLVAKLSAIRESNPEVRVYVKGDQAVSYGQMMQVMTSVTAAGVTQVAFVTEPPKTSLRAPR